MKRRDFTKAIAGIAAGVVAGTKVFADDPKKPAAPAAAPTATPAPKEHGCAGKNDCKGQGGCKTSDKGCKGKNSCKGKGGCKTTTK